MGETFSRLLQLAMAFALSLALLLPLNLMATEIPMSHCENCVMEVEEETGCCPLEEGSEAPGPCNSDDCECPDCPFCAPKLSPLAALIFSAPKAVVPSGINLHVPDPGLGDERVLESPPSPPPQAG